MSAEPDNLAAETTYTQRALSYGWLLALVGLTGPEPTATVVAAMLHSVGASAERLGSTLTIAAMQPQAVQPLWTAMPVVVLGGALILATQASLAKQVAGVTFLAVNAWLVNLMVLGVAVQVPPGTDSPVLRSLTYVSPLLMLLVVAVTVIYYRGRIMPEAPPDSVGHARELLESPETDTANG